MVYAVCVYTIPCKLVHACVSAAIQFIHCRVRGMWLLTVLQLPQKLVAMTMKVYEVTVEFSQVNKCTIIISIDQLSLYCSMALHCAYIQLLLFPIVDISST